MIGAFLRLANSGTIVSPTFPIRLRYCQAYRDALQDLVELRSQPVSADQDKQGQENPCHAYLS